MSMLLIPNRSTLNSIHLFPFDFFYETVRRRRRRLSSFVVVQKHVLAAGLLQNPIRTKYLLRLRRHPKQNPRRTSN
jgi:hypothetical protein